MSVEPSPGELRFEEEPDAPALARPERSRHRIAVRETEVDEAYGVVREDQHVARVDVAVEDPMVVQRGVGIHESLRHFGDPLRLATDFACTSPGNDIAAIEPLDCKVRATVELPRAFKPRCRVARQDAKDRGLAADGRPRVRLRRSSHLQRDLGAAFGPGARDLNIHERLHDLDDLEVAQVVTRRECGFDGARSIGRREHAVDHR